MENTALQRFLMLTEVFKKNKAAQKYLDFSIQVFYSSS